MPDRRVDVVTVGVPLARAPVQLDLEVGVAPAQLGAKHLCQENVVAVPVVSAVHPDEQHVRTREVAQHRGRARLAQNGIAERTREPVEHGRALQERDLLGREVGQQRVVDVVRHDAIVAAEPRRCGGGVGLLAQRDGGEVEPSRPPLGSLHERLDLGGAELDLRPRPRNAAATPNASANRNIAPVGWPNSGSPVIASENVP